MSVKETEYNYSANIITKVLRTRYTIRFWHEFEDIGLYKPYFDVFEKAKATDEIVIDISSWGGYGETQMSLAHMITHCECRNITAFVRVAYSAGAKLALSCPKIAFEDNASMMLHAYYQQIPYTKQQEIISRAKHFSDNFDLCADSLLRKMLSGEEVKELHNGKDFWFTRHEAIARLKKYGKGKIEIVEKI